MTLRVAFHRLLSLLLLSSLLALAPAVRAADDGVLLIDQTTGVAGVQRDGKRLALKAGDALQEQDLLVTERSGRMTLRLGRHGFVEVGPNAEIGIERLPFAAYARDLKSIFSVGKGYFRVVWKHPQLSSNWPLYVYMAGQRISLVSGEYFFQNMGKEQRACVAAGQIALQGAGAEGIETIKPPACVQFAEGKAPVTTARSTDDWIAVRRGYSIEATAAMLLAREPTPAEPVAAAPAKPIITTAPAPVFSLPPPVALAPPVEAPAIDESRVPYAAAQPAPAPVTSPLSTPVFTPLPTPVVETAAAPAALPPPAAKPVEPPPKVIPAEPYVAPPVAKPVPPPAAPVRKPAPIVATAPIIIGQVETMPAIKPQPAAPVAKSAIKPLPAVASPVASSGSGSWALNVGSYSDAAIAEHEVQRLKAAGFASAVSQPATVGGKQWHRVQIGGYASDAAARTAAQELKTRLKLANVWVLKP